MQADLETMSDEFHEMIFSSDASQATIDMQALYLAGHSFGTTTAMRSASELGPTKVRAIMCLDAWFLPHPTEFGTGTYYSQVPY